MLLILIALRQRPDLISAVVAITMTFAFRRNHLPLKQAVDIEEIMAAEGDLYQPPTDLRNNLQLHPWIGHLLGLPTQVAC